MSHEDYRSRPLQGVAARDRYSLQTTEVPGGRLAYGRWRSRIDTAAAVVAVHGITGNHRCWSFFASELSDTLVLAPDLRGRGGSASLGPPFGLAQHADDISALLDCAGLESVILVGHSMGAGVALVAADRHPDRVQALVLVDGGFPLGVERPGGPAEAAAEIVPGLKRRLAMTFPDTTTAVRFWRQHPAFRTAWSRVAEDYARYDLGGQQPYLRSRVQRESLLADSEDMSQGTALRSGLDHLRHRAQWLTAPRGLLDEEPPLYPEAAVRHWRDTYRTLDVHPVSDVNHYTIVLSRPGSQAVAAAVRRVRTDLAAGGRGGDVVSGARR